MIASLCNSISSRKYASNIKIFIKIALWYILSAFYNIYNKNALNRIHLPLTIATLQMSIGLLFIPIRFMLSNNNKNSLKFSYDTVYAIKSIVVYNVLTHIAGVFALGAGAVSFTQVVKASEPLFTSFISSVFFKEYLSTTSYITLLPIIIGVSLASLKEISFSWFCLGCGIISNLFAAARSVYSKKVMCGDTQCIEELSPENYYYLLTFLSSLLLIPITVTFEGGKLYSLCRMLLSSSSISSSMKEGFIDTLISGVLYYLYNDLSFSVLDNIHPVSHSVANVLKRIVIIVSSVIVFRNPLSYYGTVGTVLSMAGVFLYTLSLNSSTSKKQF